MEGLWTTAAHHALAARNPALQGPAAAVHQQDVSQAAARPWEMYAAERYRRPFEPFPDTKHAAFSLTRAPCRLYCRLKLGSNPHLGCDVRCGDGREYRKEPQRSRDGTVPSTGIAPPALPVADAVGGHHMHEDAGTWGGRYATATETSGAW